MSEPGDQTQVLGRDGEPCRSCGAPLAADQRYCLNCGQRRGSPRLDFRRHLPTTAAPVNGGSIQASEAEQPATGATQPPPRDDRPPRDFAPLAAVGGIAVLGLMLLVGVLIGKGNSTTATAPPQIVRVGGDGGATTAAGDDASRSQARTKKANGKATRKNGKDGNLLGGGKQNAGAVTASDDELKALQEQSPEEYSKSSAKLPDEIATPGAPPPADGKAPGGGSKGTAIE